MEIGLLLVFLGACCVRRAKADDFAGAYAGEQAGQGPWQWLRSLWSHQEPAKPVGSEKEHKDSRLCIRQELDKGSKRMITRISYKEKGRSVSVKVHENMTLEFAGLVFKLEPDGVKAQEVQKKEGGEFVPREERVTKGQKAHNDQKVWPIKVVPRAKEEMGQRDGGEAEERWGSF